MNNIVLRGVNNIQNVTARKIQNSVKKVESLPIIKKGGYDVVKDKDLHIKKEDGKFVKNDIWVLDTTGTNLLEALALDYVDPSRTISNDIREEFNILGIEAARQMIYLEMMDVMEFSGVYINYHHLSLLCDRMTCNHNMVPIFRSGLLTDDVGPIAKATFEVHTEVMLNASKHGEFDHMRGVSANVMCGQYGNYGTGSFQVILDMKEMESLDAFDVDTKDINMSIENTFAKNGGKTECSKSEIMIQNNIANIQKGTNDDICDDGYNIGF